MTGLVVILALVVVMAGIAVTSGVMMGISIAMYFVAVSRRPCDRLGDDDLYRFEDLPRVEIEAAEVVSIAAERDRRRNE